MRFALALLLLAPIAMADEAAPPAFPAWTYWVEIFEHLAMFLVAAVATAVLLSRKKRAGYAAFGFGVLALAELLTILHHFLVYPFGVWNAIFNHSLLLVAVASLAYSFVKPQSNGTGVAAARYNR